MKARDLIWPAAVVCLVALTFAPLLSRADPAGTPRSRSFSIPASTTFSFDGGAISPSSVTTPFFDGGIVNATYVQTIGAAPGMTGTAPMLLGSRSANTGGLWMAAAAAAPTTTNYVMLEDATDVYFGGPSGGTQNWCIGNSCTMQWTGSALTSAAGTVDFSIFKLGGKRMTAAAPTLQSGFGSSPSIVAGSNGSWAFNIDVGTGGTASSGVVRFATAAPVEWQCDCNDPTVSIAVTKQTAYSTTDCTLTSISTNDGGVLAWAASTVLHCHAHPE